VDIAQVERYGPYTAVYGHFTDRITAVISGAEIRRYHNVITVRIRSVYGAVLSKFTVKIRIAESIDLVSVDSFDFVNTGIVSMNIVARNIVSICIIVISIDV
jgi:hypothetical protein